MASQKQIEANRLNARKSTGPRTPEGKARSSMNALKTGTGAKTRVIRGESDSARQELAAEYYKRFQPSKPEQTMLVEMLINCDLALRHFRAMEARVWEKALAQEGSSLGRAFSKHCREFSRLQRGIDLAQRQYSTALRSLEQLRLDEDLLRPAEEFESLNASASAETKLRMLKPPNRFVV